jgi:LysM repeat protein
MSDTEPVDQTGEEMRLLQRRVTRLAGLLRLYRWGLAAAAGVILLLMGLLLFAKAPAFGRAIVIDGQPLALVRNEQAAVAVRDRLLAGAGGAEGGATFKEKWEDVTRPTDGEPVLSVNEAVRALRGKVTVLKEAVAIEASGLRLVVVANREMAQSVLDQLKARYASPSDAVVRLTKLQPEPLIRPCAVLPEKIVSDPQEAVRVLQRARRQGTYEVGAGDYPERIATAHDMSLEDFWRLNPGLRGRTLHPGQAVRVLTSRGGLTVVTVRETVTTLAIPPPVSKQATATLPKGHKKIADPGKPGSKRVRWEVTMRNDREVGRRSLSEEIITEPRPQVVLVGTK